MVLFVGVPSSLMYPFWIDIFFNRHVSSVWPFQLQKGHTTSLMSSRLVRLPGLASWAGVSAAGVLDAGLGSSFLSAFLLSFFLDRCWIFRASCTALDIVFGIMTFTDLSMSSSSSTL